MDTTKRINAIGGDSIAVDHWTEDKDNDAVWLYVRHGRASLSLHLTKDQARALALALTQIADSDI